MLKKEEAEAIVYVDLLAALDNDVEPELMRTYTDQGRRKLKKACSKLRVYLFKNIMKRNHPEQEQQ